MGVSYIDGCFQQSDKTSLSLSMPLSFQNRMTTLYDVPAEALMPKLADKLKGNENIKPPEWAVFVKTGVHREKPPVKGDWWYTRAAAVFRKVYIEGPIGVSRLSALFGGAEDRRVKPDRARKGSGSIVRHVLKQLESAGFVSNVKGKGRVVSPSGRSFLDNTAYEVMQEVVKGKPELSKY